LGKKVSKRSAFRGRAPLKDLMVFCSGKVSGERKEPKKTWVCVGAGKKGDGKKTAEARGCGEKNASVSRQEGNDDRRLGD